MNPSSNSREYHTVSLTALMQGRIAQLELNAAVEAAVQDIDRIIKCPIPSDTVEPNEFLKLLVNLGTRKTKNV